MLNKKRLIFRWNSFREKVLTKKTLRWQPSEKTESSELLNFFISKLEAVPNFYPTTDKGPSHFTLDHNFKNTRSKPFNFARALTGHFLTDCKRNFFEIFFTNKIKIPSNLILSPIFKNHMEILERMFEGTQLLSTYTNFGNSEKASSEKSVERTIALYLEKLNGVPVRPKDILLVNDISKGIEKILDLSVFESSDAVLLPRPFNFFCNELVAFKRAKQIFYTLEAGENWQFNFEHLQKDLNEAVKSGLKPKVFLLDHPSYLTSATYSREFLARLLRFCFENNLLLVVNESLQHLSFTKEDFCPMRQILAKMPAEISGSLQLVILDSLKTSLFSDNGIRAAHLELVNFDEKSIDVLAGLNALDPPGLVDLAIYFTNFIDRYNLYPNDYSKVFNLFIERSFLTVQVESRLKYVFFDKMAKKFDPNHVLGNIKGGYYHLLKIDFPEKFIELAKEQKKTPDWLFCEMLAEHQLLAAWPGVFFGCEEGNRIRVCWLPVTESIFLEAYDRLITFYQKIKIEFS